MTEQDKPVEEFRTLWGARVLWPSDMPDDMLEFSVRQATEQLETKNPDKQGADICDAIKKAFDDTWGQTWVIVCGKNFGCHAVHEKQKFVYFYIGQYAFMFYKI